MYVIIMSESYYVYIYICSTLHLMTGFNYLRVF